MSETLKSHFDVTTVRRIGAMLRAADSSFDEQRFVRDAARGLETLELLDRGRHVGRAMGRALPEDFERAARIVETSLGPVLDHTESHGMAPFLYMPHAVFVAERGIEHFEASMRLQHAITQRFTAEWSIRPFLARWPDETFARLRQWATDPSAHVRRLVSEGTRSRLPWASRVPLLLERRAQVIALLDLLKDDPALYVRRSVANNLNDIGKDDATVCIAVCRRWLRGASKERIALVRHALRWLVKQGDRRALDLLGADGPDGLVATGRVTPRRAALGDVVLAEIDVKNVATTARRAVVDLVVHYVKADGKTRPKVFKVGELDMRPGESERLEKRVTFVDRTTRRHYAGKHVFAAMVNGAQTAIGTITLRC